MIDEKTKRLIITHYTRTVLKTNLAKTSTSSALIAAGLILVQNGLTSSPTRFEFLISGVLAVALGFTVNYLGDKHKVRAKREEVDIINNALRRSNERIIKDLEDTITEHITAELQDRLAQMLRGAKRRRE